MTGVHVERHNRHEIVMDFHDGFFIAIFVVRIIRITIVINDINGIAIFLMEKAINETVEYVEINAPI